MDANHIGQPPGEDRAQWLGSRERRVELRERGREIIQKVDEQFIALSDRLGVSLQQAKELYGLSSTTDTTVGAILTSSEDMPEDSWNIYRDYTHQELRQLYLELAAGEWKSVGSLLAWIPDTIPAVIPASTPRSNCLHCLSCGARRRSGQVL